MCSYGAGLKQCARFLVRFVACGLRRGLARREALLADEAVPPGPAWAPPRWFRPTALHRTAAASAGSSGRSVSIGS